jgi:hypothetical protein
MLTPRGYTNRIELQLAQCEALLKHHIQDFHIDDIDDILIHEGIDVQAIAPNLSNAFQFPANPSNRGPPSPDGKSYPYPPQAHLMPPGYPMMPYGPPGAPYALHMPMKSSGSGAGSYNPHTHPTHPPQAPPAQPMPSPTNPSRASAVQDIRGQDPQANDMSRLQVCLLVFFVVLNLIIR